MAEVPQTDSASPRFSVVGIGASAGGITALQALFTSIHATPDLAFVVEQHLLRDQPSQLARLLASWTRLPVREAADGIAIEPGDARAGVLRVAAHRGFDQWFLDLIAQVDASDGSAGGMAMARRRVCFEDIDAEEHDDDYRATAKRAGYRLTETELRLTDIFADQLSSALERAQVELALRDNERDSDPR